MEELEVKAELHLISEEYVSNIQETPQSSEKPDTQESKEVVATAMKKPKMEIELDFSLLKNEYFKPRQRHAVKRYQDIVLLEAESKKKLIDDANYYKKSIGNSDNELLKCDMCDMQCSTARDLKIHKQQKHFKSSTFTCALCSSTFDTNNELKKHKITHRDKDKNFLCMKCKTAFSDHLEYLKHKLSHEKGPSYYCVECGKEFDYKNGYLIHIETHYDRLVECDICHREYNVNRIKAHKSNHNKIACVECGKEYDKKSLTYHMISHTGVKPYQCLYCGKGFSNASQRDVHTRIHTNEKPYGCKKCHRTFRQTIDLQRHMERHTSTDNPLKCAVCHKSFKHKQSLKYHMDIHNNTHKYECNICGFKVNTNTGLRSHFMRQHTEKKFECEPCGVSFKTPSDLFKHKKWKKHLNNVYGYKKKMKDGVK